LLHNNHWNITHDLFGWWLIPPIDVDPQQVPRPMPSKSLAFQDLERHRDRQQENSAREAEEAGRADQVTRAEEARRVEQPIHAQEARRAVPATHARRARRTEQATRAEDARQEELAELAMLTLLMELERAPHQHTG
jgi:hypothetical protein